MRHRLFQRSGVKSSMACAFSVALVMGFSGSVKADAIPYAGAGVENPTTYTFTAASSGDIVAYFAGSGALYENDLGLLVNGVDRGIYGLDNYLSIVGDSLNFGAVTAGDTLVFVMRNLNTFGYPYGFPVTPASLGNVYSDATLNAAYDSTYGPSGSHNHVYSTAYTGTGPVIDSIPAGTYVGFEDLPATNPPDWNYFDENFVFTNVATEPSVPEPVGLVSLLGLSAMGLIGCIWRRKRLAA